MLTLYTPATGFPDLEIKIAYGLARVGIEAGYLFSLVADKGFYRLEFQVSDLDKLKSSFLSILKRFLSSDRFFDLGVKAKDKGKYFANEEVIDELTKINISDLFGPRIIGDINIGSAGLIWFRFTQKI